MTETGSIDRRLGGRNNQVSTPWPTTKQSGAFSAALSPPVFRSALVQAEHVFLRRPGMRERLRQARHGPTSDSQPHIWG